MATRSKIALANKSFGILALFLSGPFLHLVALRLFCKTPKASGLSALCEANLLLPLARNLLMLFQMRASQEKMPVIVRRGTDVALTPDAMRWSELIILYLAVGAPIGVSYALRPRPAQRAPRLAWGASVVTALFWPLAVARWLRNRALGPRQLRTTLKDAPDDPLADLSLATVRTLADLTRILQQHNATPTIENLWQQVREGLEVYVGLTRAVREIDETAPASPRTLALYGIAGYSGDELENAGRCVQRRNANRLRLHQSQAREDFLTMWDSLEKAVAATLHRIAENHSAVNDVGNIWHDFTECVRRLCIALGDDAAALAATRWMARAKPVFSGMLSVPAVEKNLPPQNGGTECLPLKDLPFLNLPERTSRLG